MSEQEKLSLAQIAGINLDDIKAVRFENLPVGAYDMKVIEATLDNVGKDENPAAVVKHSVVAVHGLMLDAGDNEAAYVGKEHTERFLLRDVTELGRFKAYLEDCNAPKKSGALQDTLAALVNHTFPAKIAHRTDKNDKSIVYARLSFTKDKAKKAA
jgi:hypothetical protein